MQSSETIVLSLAVVINVATFVMYGWDKRCAVKDRWRVPEKVLLSLAVLGGATGAAAGMTLFHHKTKHLKFTITVTVCFLIQLYLVYSIL